MKVRVCEQSFDLLLRLICLDKRHFEFIAAEANFHSRDRNGGGSFYREAVLRDGAFRLNILPRNHQLVIRFSAKLIFASPEGNTTGVAIEIDFAPFVIGMIFCSSLFAGNDAFDPGQFQHGSWLLIFDRGLEGQQANQKQKSGHRFTPVS